MSNWTHVAAIVRIDGLVGLTGPIDVIGIFGKECLFESDADTWKDAYRNPDRYLPMGSEGSLQMSIWENSDTSSLAAVTVSIFGDLRDHDDPQQIVDWFKRKVKGQLVRQAVITVENEKNGTVTWTYEH